MKEMNHFVKELKLAFQSRTLTSSLHDSFILLAYAIYIKIKYYIVLANTKVFNFPLKNKKFKLNFNKGLISANIGCNTISGMYEIKDDVLHVGPLSMTRKECTEKEENLDLFVITFLSERPDIYLNNDSTIGKISHVFLRMDITNTKCGCMYYATISIFDKSR